MGIQARIPLTWIHGTGTNRCTPNNKTEKHGRAVSIRLEDDRVDAFLARMETDEAKAAYKTRAPIAEFPNAWIKTNLNWVRVRSRGLKRVAAEALWPVLTYNLQRYFTITRQIAQTTQIRAHGSQNRA